MAINGIDHILEFNQERIVTEKVVDGSEALFEDHFPGYPVYPGVMMLEGLAQSAAWFVLKTTNFSKSQARIASVNQVKYSKLVRPKTTLRFEVTPKAGELEFKGRVLEGERAVAQATFSMRLDTIDSISPNHKDLEEIINQKNRRLFEELTLSGCKSTSKHA